jgi:hypothetical protein
MKLQHSNAYKNIIFNLSKLDHKFAQELRFPNEKIKKLIGNKKKRKSKRLETYVFFSV